LQEHIVNIKLAHCPFLRDGYGENNIDGFMFYNCPKSIRVMYPFGLIQAFGYHSSFKSLKRAINTVFIPKDPFALYKSNTSKEEL